MKTKDIFLVLCLLVVSLSISKISESQIKTTKTVLNGIQSGETAIAVNPVTMIAYVWYLIT